MTDSFDLSQTERARLGVLVGEIERELSCLGRQATIAEHRAAARGLMSAWSRFAALLAHGRMSTLEEGERTN